LFKQKINRTRTVSRVEGIAKLQIFGVDPATLECISDSNYKIPKLLAMLKTSIVKHSGFETEGIFRLSASESKLKDIKYELNTNTFTDSTDVHCCASLIKRWYGELPTRVFTALTMEMIDEVVNDVDESMALARKLPEPERSLYLWLVDLLFQVSQYQEKNKMVPANLAICVAPQMMNINFDNPTDAFFLNQKICNFVQNCITYRLKELELGKLSPYARAPTDPTPEIQYESQW